MALISRGGGVEVAAGDTVASSTAGVFSASFSAAFSASSSASPFDHRFARCFSFVVGTGMLKSRGRNHAFLSAGSGRDSKLIWKSRGKRCFVTQHKRTGDARVKA